MLDTIISFMSAHVFIMYMLVFLISFLEFIILIGNIVPGTTALFVISFFAAQSEISILYFFLLAMIGSLLGDFLSYYIGKKYGRKFLRRFGLITEEKEFENLSKMKLKEGKWLSFILLGKLNSLIRSFTGFAGGMKKMSLRRFLFMILLGNLIWTSVYVFLPYSLGHIAKKYIYFVNGITFILVALIFVSISIADGSIKEVIDFIKERLRN